MDDGADSDAPTAADTADPHGATQPASRRAGRLSLPGYDIGEALGRGGMGEVLLARDPEIGRDVAIKRIVGEDPDPSLVARFMREAKIQARLEHPAIVPVHEIGRDSDGRPYFSMKRLAGTTLQDVLRDPHADRPRMLRALVDVCNALELAHRNGVVHRDVKPANVMLGDFGEVYVLDWGIARVIADPELGSSPGLASEETQVGAVLGTVGYMAPEQLRDATSVGPAADVYSLGCILFEILAATPAHPRGDAMASTLVEAMLSPIERAPDRNIAPELDMACAAALAFEPAKRPSARALGERIQRYLDGDRDLEHRRKLAREHLAIALEAIADPARRAEATREAGRALALDPASGEASALVASLMFDPPEVLPSDLAAHLNELDRDVSAQTALDASKTMFAFVAILPVLMWTGIASWPWLIAMGGAMLVASAIAYYTGRTRRTNDFFALVYMSVLCILVSRLAGAFLIVPGMMMISMMGLAQQATYIRHPFVLAAGGVIAFVTPVAFELVGVFGPTMAFPEGRIEIRSTMLDLGGTATFVSLLVPNVMMVVAAAVFGRRLALSRREAIRSLEVQKWHYSRLIPST